MRSTQRIAVLGGGGAGTCAALEIAAHGHLVDIFEQEELPVTAASRVNEGKIHLGILYANDPAARTADLMIRGALSFSELLSRWFDLTPADLTLSTPFLYAVHRDSMVSPDDLSRHYEATCAEFGRLQVASGSTYLGQREAPSFRRLSAREIEAVLDPQHFAAVFQTSERAVDPRVVADRMRQVVLDTRGVTFHGGCRVASVARTTRGFDVTLSDGSVRGPYDQVINTTWAGRLRIDRSMGIEPPRSWLHRHKFGTRVLTPLRAEQLPSVTMVLGPFGDIVNFAANGMYLSWYPIGMVATSLDLEPPASWASLSRDARLEVFRRSRAVWDTFCPLLADLEIEDAVVDPVSGPIFAWGDTDIDDPASELHERFTIGVHSSDGYHSVNTGKYTTMPYMAMEAAKRVLAQ